MRELSNLLVHVLPPDVVGQLKVLLLPQVELSDVEWLRHQPMLMLTGVVGQTFPAPYHVLTPLAGSGQTEDKMRAL